MRATALTALALLVTLTALTVLAFETSPAHARKGKGKGKGKQRRPTAAPSAAPTTRPTAPPGNCAPQCPNSFVGDGYCEIACAAAESCGFDAVDCAKSLVATVDHAPFSYGGTTQRYPPLVNDVITITPQDPSCFVQITFTRVDVADDTLAFVDADGNDIPRELFAGMPYCPPVAVPETNGVKLHFASGPFFQATGFAFLYAQTCNATCPFEPFGIPIAVPAPGLPAFSFSSKAITGLLGRGVGITWDLTLPSSSELPPPSANSSCGLELFFSNLAINNQALPSLQLDTLVVKLGFASSNNEYEAETLSVLAGPRYYSFSPTTSLRFESPFFDGGQSWTAWVRTRCDLPPAAKPFWGFPPEVYQLRAGARKTTLSGSSLDANSFRVWTLVPTIPTCLVRLEFEGISLALNEAVLVSAPPQLPNLTPGVVGPAFAGANLTVWFRTDNLPAQRMGFVASYIQDCTTHPPDYGGLIPQPRVFPLAGRQPLPLSIQPPPKSDFFPANLDQSYELRVSNPACFLSIQFSSLVRGSAQIFLTGFDPTVVSGFDALRVGPTYVTTGPFLTVRVVTANSLTRVSVNAQYAQVCNNTNVPQGAVFNANSLTKWTTKSVRYTNNFDQVWTVATQRAGCTVQVRFISISVGDDVMSLDLGGGEALISPPITNNVYTSVASTAVIRLASNAAFVGDGVTFAYKAECPGSRDGSGGGNGNGTGYGKGRRRPHRGGNSKAKG